MRPILATGTWVVKKSSGFTLLEVMLTLVLIGIITSFAVLTIPGQDRAQQLAGTAQQLAARVKMHHQEAILLGQQRGLQLQHDAYRFWQLHQSGQWLEITPGEQQLPPAISLQARVEGRRVDLNSDRPQILLLSSGEATEFNVTLQADGEISRQVSADLVGRVQVQ